MEEIAVGVNVHNVAAQYNYAKKEITGRNIIKNGDFTNGEADWTFINNNDGKWEVLDNKAELIAGNGGIDSFFQLLTVRSGVTYRLTYTILSIDNGGLNVRMQNLNNGSISGLVRNSPGTYSHDFEIDINNSDPDNNVTINFFTDRAGVSLEIDNIQLTVLDGPYTSKSQNHGDLINFEIGELGTLDKSDVTSVLDKYSKQSTKSFGLFQDNIIANRRIEVREEGATINTSGNDFAIFYKCINDIFIDANETEILHLFNDNSGNAWFNLVFKRSGGLIAVDLRMQAPFTDRARFQIPDRKNITICFIKKGDDSSQWRLVANGTEYALVNFDNDSLTGNDLPNYQFGSILAGYQNANARQRGLVNLRAALYDGIPSNEIISAFMEDEKLPESGILEEVNFGKVSSFSDGGTSIKGKPQVYRGFVDGTEDQLFVGKKSAIPPISSALLVDRNTKRIRIPASDVFNPGNENGYTFTFGYALDTDRDFDLDYFFSNRSAPSALLFAGNGPNEIVTSHPIASSGVFDVGNQNLNFINCVTVTIKPESGERNTTVYHNGIRIGQYGGGGNILDLSTNNQDARFFWDVVGALNGFLICAGVWSRVFDDNEVRKFYNNSFFNQPPIDDSTEVYFQFNETSFFEDGTDVRIKDLSNKNKTITYTGWNGANSTDQLTDLLNNVIPINRLR